MIGKVLYLATALLWLYSAWFFYRTKNGLLRKALIMLFLGVGGASMLRLFLNMETINIIIVSLVFIPLLIFNIIITFKK